MLSLLIIDNDDNSRFATRSELEEIEFISEIFDSNSLEEGYSIAITHHPHIILVDISYNTEAGLNLVDKLSRILKQSFILVSSDDLTVNTALASMRAGAREVLKRPINSRDLIDAIYRAKDFTMDNSDSDYGGKIITIFSNKGGIGKSTIATNLAVGLASMTNKKVALIDLNLQLGDITTFLDITSSYDIAYVVNNLDRIDEEFLLSSLDKYKDTNLYVLADPPYAEQAEDISSEQINSLLTALKSIFNYIVIDTTSSFDAKTLVALDLADYIFLISMINLPCIRNTQRCLDLFNRLNYSREKIKLVINRYMPDEELTLDDVEDTLEHPVYWMIPNNYFNVMTAINRGMPIYEIDPESSISKNFVELGQKIIGPQEIITQQPLKEPPKNPIKNIVNQILKK